MKSFYAFVFLVLVALLFVILPSIVHAEDAQAGDVQTNPYADTVTGDWAGERMHLSDYGLDFTIEYKGDVMADIAGGIKTGTNYLDNLDVKLALDNQKLLGLSGNRAFIYFLNNNGGKPNSGLGSMQGVDNIEVHAHRSKLYEFWDEQSFWDGRFSFLAGLHDLNSEFDGTDITGNFIMPGYQIGQDFAQSGHNGPSIFPNTSLAARAKFLPTSDTYMQAGIFQAVCENMRSTNMKLVGKEGALLIAEAGLIPQAKDGDAGPDKFAFGGWMYTKGYDDLVDIDTQGNPIKRASYGFYFLSSYQFYKSDAGETLTAFFRPGINDGNTKPTSWAYESGVVGQGWIAERPQAEIGFGFAQAHNGDKYIQSVTDAGGRALANEYDFELYYRDQIMPGVYLQPDIQYVVNPGTDPTISNGVVLGLRLDLKF